MPAVHPHPAPPQASIERYFDLVPQLLKTERAGLFKTLRDLGLRSGDQARRQGHICVREPRGGAYRTIAGLWVAQDDLSAFEQAAQALLAAKDREEHDQQQALEERFERDFDLSLTTLDERASRIVREALRETKNQTAAHRRIACELASQAAEPMRARLYLCQGELRLRCTFELGGRTVAGSVPLAPKQACMLVLAEGARCSELVARLVKKFHADFCSQWTRWASERPAWFDEAYLQRWVLGRSTQHPAVTEEHPVQAWLARPPAHADLGCLSLEGKGPKRTSTVRGTVQFAGLRTKLVQRWPLDVLGARLWQQKEPPTAREALERASIRYLEERQQQLTEFEQLFCDAFAWGERQRELGLTESAWKELLHEALRQYCLHEIEGTVRESKSWANARRHVETQLLQHASRHAAQKTRSELPARLEDFYPVARSLGRKLVLVVGPTNSGKTHRALERLRAADTGAYLGPLRLLALEVRDRLQEAGTRTSLVTGELIEEVQGARHTAATVEMLDFEQVLDVAVIDEVQMLADPQRGFAWLQAVLGAPGREVWMLGAPEARGAVEHLAQRLGEPLEVIETQRLAPLQVHKRAAKLGALPPQSAVIAFSRRDVLQIAGELREAHGRKTAVLYGALSPEVRREQARLFASGEADVVVATDAIGMGLNLPIHKLYFSTAVKWNGQQEVRVPRALVWQIAGRAGRFGLHEAGEVGALDGVTLDYVRKVLARPPEVLRQQFRYAPSWPVVKKLAQHLATEHLPTLLAFFRDELRLGDAEYYRPGLGEDQLTLAHATVKLSLTLHEQLMLSTAPVPLDKGEVPGEFLRFAQALANRAPFRVDELKSLQAQYVEHDAERAERAVKLLNLYCWLHYRAPEVFIEREAAMAQIAKLNAAISRHLNRTRGKRCGDCGKSLPWQHAFRICEGCYQGPRAYRRHEYGYGGFGWD